MTSKNDQKVAVAYLHPHDVSAKFHRSLVNLLALDTMGAKLPDGSKLGGRGRVFAGGAILDYSSGAQITKTRNRAVRDFLALDGIDWLWCVDSDMTFEPDILERLIGAAHPTLRPVVGGLCFAYMRDQSRRFWPTLYAYVPGSNRLRRLTSYPDDTLVPVAGTGAACLLIHRSVLEAMAERYPPPWPWFAETPFYEVDEHGANILETGDAYSEDLTFCLRAQACGFPVAVHTGIKLGHVKEFEADEAGFIAEAEQLHAASVPALPTYAVVASKDRQEMLATLLGQLDGQVTTTFVFDNGYTSPLPYANGDPVLGVDSSHAVKAHGYPLHRMWNEGLDTAAVMAAGGPHNVLIVNDDVEVPNELCARLEAALRASDDHWIAYPNHQGLDLAGAPFARTASDTMAGQTMPGWCFMLRGEAGLRFDERYGWWYGDSDLERTVRANGRHVVCVDVPARHLDPIRSTLDNPERLAQAHADEAVFAEKWDLDPSTLWLARRDQQVGA